MSIKQTKNHLETVIYKTNDGSSKAFIKQEVVNCSTCK